MLSSVSRISDSRRWQGDKLPGSLVAYVTAADSRYGSEPKWSKASRPAASRLSNSLQDSKRHGYCIGEAVWLKVAASVGCRLGYGTRR
jgi:hypothetical protein